MLILIASANLALAIASANENSELYLEYSILLTFQSLPEFIIIECSDNVSVGKETSNNSEQQARGDQEQGEHLIIQVIGVVL